jgi:hypothetical protein
MARPSPLPVAMAAAQAFAARYHSETRYDELIANNKGHTEEHINTDDAEGDDETPL